MKSIKTTDGWYIDQSKIDSFTVAKYFGTDGKGEGFAACTYIYGQRWRLKEFALDPSSTTQFDSKDVAKKSPCFIAIVLEDGTFHDS